MDEPGPSGIGQSNANRDDGAKDAVVDVAVNQKQTADIFKLDIDCFEEAFDYMPLDDLISVGETCKRLQQVAGHCYQQNFPANAYCDSRGIMGYKDCNQAYYNVEHFAPFIQDIVIVTGKGFEYFFDARSKFKRIKNMGFCGLGTTDLFGLRGFPIEKLECIFMGFCDLGNDFHEIIDRCTKLKHLEISSCTGEHNWFDRKYPTLERFTFNQSNSPTEGILMLLELNPNIRRFGTNSTFIREHRDKMMTANIKLDDLAVQIIQEDFHAEFDQLIDLLNKLHERGFYRKLHVYFTQIQNQEEVNQLSTVNGLVKLSEQEARSIPLTLSELKNLEELSLQASNSIVDVEILPKNLINLNRIEFDYASIDDIMSFIRLSVEMEKITVHIVVASSVHFNEDTKVVDLLALNREREKLPDAQKITLYVTNKIYLATKWEMEETDFGLIRLKRLKVVDWSVDFICSN